MTALAPRRRPPAPRPSLLRGFFWLLLGLLYLPILILFVFSLNAGTTLSFPLKGFTLDWYARLFDDPGAARLRSDTACSSRSRAARRDGARDDGRDPAEPVRVPGQGPADRARDPAADRAVRRPRRGAADPVHARSTSSCRSSRSTIGHAIVALPYTTLIVLARLVGAEPQLEDAAMDLGATYPGTLRLVVIPMAAPAIISAWITAFTVSFDEFAIALFLAGPDRTFPVYLVRPAALREHAAGADRHGRAADGRDADADPGRRPDPTPLTAPTHAAVTAAGIRMPASEASSSALSVRSQGRSRSRRPKWPYAAVWR